MVLEIAKHEEGRIGTTCHIPEWRARIDCDPRHAGSTQVQQANRQQNSMSHSNSGVDNNRFRMLRTREDVYQPGFPAKPGEHYGAFVRFAAKHAGDTVLDLGCGYGAYSLALASSTGRKC